MNKYYESVNNYYKLKNDYEESYKNKKNKIKKMFKSKREIKDKITNIKKRCVKCGEIGGTNFFIKDQTLMAVCNCSTPCDLNISIKIKKVLHVVRELESLNKKISELKGKIIQIKLNLLFNLEKEEETMKRFEEKKTIYNKLLKKKNFIVTIIQKINEAVIKNEEGKDETVDKKKAIEVLEIELYDKLKQTNELKNEYIQELNSDQNPIEKLLDSLRIYKNEIILLNTKIRELKYQDIIIEETPILKGKTKNVVQYKYHIHKTPVLIESYEILKEKYVSNK